MSTISTALRNFKEPTKDQLTEIFFSLPATAVPTPKKPSNGSNDEKKPSGGQDEPVERMDINAVLSLGVQGEEDSYVRSALYLFVCLIAYED